MVGPHFAHENAFSNCRVLVRELLGGLKIGGFEDANSNRMLILSPSHKNNLPSRKAFTKEGRMLPNDGKLLRRPVAGERWANRSNKVNEFSHGSKC